MFDLSRRLFLKHCGMGLPALAAGALLTEQAQAGPLAPKPPHFAPKAKRVIHLFMNGGPSQVDTFDPKPALAKYAGKELPFKFKTERRTGAAFPSPFEFKRHGESGLPVSEIYPELSKHVDEMCVIRSMHSPLPNHEPSLMLMNCGDVRQVRPSFGSWITYGLGSENQNLPGFVVLCPGGFPVQGAHNWRSAFLPGAFQGTHIDTKKTDIDELIAHIRNPTIPLDEQRQQLDLLAALNRRYTEDRPADARLESRLESFELAYRMQMEAADVFDVSKEPKHVREAYGDTLHGRQILMGRRLLERGVRFVQIWHGAGQPWDSHNDIETNHRKLANENDKPIAALLTDLKERGMLDETLVLWGGEFGRTPTVELAEKGANEGMVNGRDHNPHGFTVWVAGGGIKGGTAYGSTDEFGFAAARNKVHVHDLHATLLHLLGFDHEKFTYRYAGRDFRLTDVHGHVVRDILA